MGTFIDMGSCLVVEENKPIKPLVVEKYPDGGDVVICSKIGDGEKTFQPQPPYYGHCKW